MTWDLLGIKRTGDKLLIKKAYALQLKKCHPEENPNGFIALRQAYESALKEADRLVISNETGQLESNISIVEIHNDIEISKEDSKLNKENRNETFSGQRAISTFSKIHEIYDDFFQRIKLDRWKSLMLDFSIDEYGLLGRYICSFLNEHDVLPLHIWQYLNKEFCLEENNNFKQLDLLKYDYGLRYDLFDKKNKCDYSNYAKIRLQGLLEFKNACYEKAIDMLEQAEKLYAKDESLFRIRGYANYMLKHYNEALEDFNKALSIKSNDVDSLLGRGNLLLNLNHFTKAKKDFHTALKIAPQSRVAAIGRIKAIYGCGQFLLADIMYKSYKKKGKPGDLELDVLFSKRANGVLRLKAKDDTFTFKFFATIAIFILLGPPVLLFLIGCFIDLPLFRYIVPSVAIWGIIKWYRRKKVK
jgi:tetratricopeptide (TPR) repeat protein